mmetsp:Transcript_32188/g.54051  ORF Transcript_32188/g.54051 Transcript_32188/m.54051 type:complete len:208 (+) Transcript_32188:250-873(+)
MRGHRAQALVQLRVLAHEAKQSLGIEETQVVHDTLRDTGVTVVPVGDVELLLVVRRLVPHVLRRHAMSQPLHHPQGLLGGLQKEEAGVARGQAHVPLHLHRRREPGVPADPLPAVGGGVIPAVRHALHVSVAVEVREGRLHPHDVHVGQHHRGAHAHEVAQDLELQPRGGVVVGGPGSGGERAHPVREVVLAAESPRLLIQSHDQHV